MAISLGPENVEYEPEQFPGLVYGIAEPKTVTHPFGTGKTVCTGGKRIEDVRKGVEIMANDLRRAGFL